MVQVFWGKCRVGEQPCTIRSIYCNNLFIPEIPFHWYTIHYVAVDPRNDVVVVVALKQFVEQFIKNFFVVCSCFKKDHLSSVRLKVSAFFLWENSIRFQILYGFWMLRVYAWPYSKGLWYLAINFQLYHYVIILIDVQRLGISMSFSTNELGNFWKLFCFGLILLFLEKKNHQMSNNSKLK
jgi:hypothetical protein